MQHTLCYKEQNGIIATARFKPSDLFTQCSSSSSIQDSEHNCGPVFALLGTRA